MATTAGTNLHVDPSEIGHRYRPADNDRAGYGTLVLGRPGYAACANLFFEDTAAIDLAIAELVALKQEMDPPVPGCDCMADAAPVEFTSDSRLTSARCHQPGEHHANLAGAVVDCDRPEHHQPAPELFISGSPFCTERDGRTGTLCELPLHHDGDHRAPGDEEGDPDVTWSDAVAEGGAQASRYQPDVLTGTEPLAVAR
jgi:hypothetical protein